MRVRGTGLLSLILSGVALGQSPAELAPPDSLAYIGWRGTTDPGPAFAGSRWEAALKDSQIGRMIDETLPAIGSAAERKFPQKGALIHAATSVVRQVLRKPSAAFLSMTDAGPRGGLLCQAGTDAKELTQTFQQIAAQLPPQATARVVSDDDRVGLVFGYVEDDPVAGGLDRDPKFASSIKHVSAEPTSVAYINASVAREQLDAFLARPSPNDNDLQYKEYLRRFVVASGLDGVNAVVSSAGFDGRDWRMDTFVDAPAPRKGLLDIAAPAAPDATLLGRVPASAHSVASFYFDSTKALAVIRAVAADVDPRAGDVVDKAVGGATLAIGKNVQTDLLASLGSGWAAYTSPVTGGSAATGLVLVNKLANPLKAKQAMAALSIFLSNSSQNLLRDKNVMIAGRMTRAGDLSVYYVAAPLFSPAWTIKDGYLYLGLYPQTVVSAARYAGPGITKTPAFADAAKLAGDGVPLSVSYTDVASTLGEGYGLAVAASRTAFGLSDLFLAPTPELLFPPLDALAAQGEPAVGVAWADDAGLHSRSRSPFPGAEGLANLSLTNLYLGNVPLTVSVLLPSLNRAREAADRIKSSSNLRQISLGCRMYANEHKDKMPADFVELLKTQELTPDVFVNPRDGAAEGTWPPAGANDSEAVLAWVAEHSGYVYVGGGKETSTAADTILAYEKPAGLSDGINVAFFDGHVDFVPFENVDAVFAAGGATPPTH